MTVRSLRGFLRRKSESFSICSIINHCSACGDVQTFTRGLTLALGSDVSAKFGLRLFDSFNESRVVDCTFIVVMYKALAYATLAYRNPTSIFLKLLDEYTTLNGDIRCDHKVGNILKIISIAAVTKDEQHRTSGLLKDQITNTHGAQISRLTILELEKALDSSPSVMDQFRLQLVNQLPSAKKLELLCVLEDESLGAFVKISKAIGVKRMHAFRMRRLLRCVDAWRMDVELSHRFQTRRKKTALSAWKNEAHRLKTIKMLEEISLISFYNALIRRNFIKWQRLVALRNRIQSICRNGNIDKDARAASAHLRIFAKKLNRRLAYSTWISFTLLERRCEYAYHWHERTAVKLSFKTLHRHCILEIQQRKDIREASKIQQKKLEQLQQQSLEHERDCDRKRPKWRYAKLRPRQLNENEIVILTTQRELRRKRVENTKREMEKAFHSKWLAKQSEFEASGRRRIEAWTATSDYKLLFEDQEKKYKRILSDAIDEHTENALTSNEVISYSILDGLMADALVDPEIVFKSLPDPIDIVALEMALNGVNCNTAHLERLFKGIAGQSKTVTKGRFRELQRLSNQYVGPEGSLWKIYVCSTSRRIQLHNVSSGQTIAAIKKKHLRQVIRENLLSGEMLKVRRTIYEMKQQAHRSMSEQQAAKTIQFMFRLWKGRRLRKRKSWIVDRLRLKTQEKEA